MNALLSQIDKLPESITGQNTLVMGPKAARTEMLTLSARLACQGPLRVLDAGNGFNAYVVARLMRHHTEYYDAALDHITVARAFTCYQVQTLLTETSASAIPTLVLDLLSTFHDESVPFYERRRLLSQSIVQLRRLGRYAPLVISSRPPLETPPLLLSLDSQRSPQVFHAESQQLVGMLRDFAERVWVAEEPAVLAQPRLF